MKIQFYKTHTWMAFTLPLLLSSLLFASCEREELMKETTRPIRVEANLPGTRTSFVEEGNMTHVDWNKDDAIGLSTGEGNWTYKALQAGRKTSFTSEAANNELKAADGETVYAYYPGSITTVDGQPLHIRIPGIETQTYGENPTRHDVLLAHAPVNNGVLSLPFKHKYAFLRITLPSKMVLKNSGIQGLCIESTESISRTEHVYDLQKQEQVASDRFPGKVSNTLHYNIPNTVTEAELTCYIAILPQSQNAEIKISRHENRLVRERLLTRKVPQGGFNAGHIYTVSIIESESEIEERITREALIAFYKATDGPNWKNNTNWCTDKPLNEWHGLRINQHNQLYNINLNSNKLKGDISNAITALQPLKHLEHLQLGWNQLSGTLPANLGNIASLKILSLCSNQLSGPLPTTLSNMASLEYLELSSNQFSGTLPANLSNIISLKGLDLSSNRLNSVIPATLGDLKSIEYLDLSSNQLSGSIPAYLSNMTSLKTLSLSSNQLNGAIPATLGNLKSLEYLDLSSNQLNGAIPTTLGNLKSLEYLNLFGNQLSGSIPVTLGELSCLKELRLGSNQLTGSLPENLYKINILNLCYNQFTGNIPASYASLLKNEPRIDLRYNQLSGTLPTEISSHPNFYRHWDNILPQNKGYGFTREDLPAHTHSVKCYDGNLLNLGETYAKNKYTLHFEWEPDAYSIVHIDKVVRLYQTYKKKGLGVIASTRYKYPDSSLSKDPTPYFEQMAGIPQFWEESTPYESHNNNPDYQKDGDYTFYGFGATPVFYIIDSKGYIIYFGNVGIGQGVVPQHDPNADNNVFDYVARLFGDEQFNPNIK